MLFAAVTDDSYNVVLFIHIVAFLVTFAPAAINPFLERHLAETAGDSAVQNWARFGVSYTLRASLGGLVVLLLTGVLLVLMSDDAWEFSQTWISLAFLVWLAIGGVVSAMILKGERKLMAGDMTGRDLIAKGGPIASVLGLVMLYLMIFKPGL